MQLLKNIKKNTLLLLVITIVTLCVVLKDDFSGIMQTLQTLDLKFILVALILFLFSVSLKGYSNYLIVNDKKKISLKEAIKHNFITQLFNGITPFSSGGQPMEIYMLTEHGISFSKATNYTVQSFIFYQIALIILGTLAVMYNFVFHIFPKVKLLQHLVLLGFIINIAVIVFLIFISYSKRFMRKSSRALAKISKKLKLNISEAEIDKKLEEYHDGFRELKHNKKLIFTGIGLNLLSLISLYLIPLFILFSMNNFHALTIIETITTSAYVYLIGAFVPVPGASGGIEYGFSQLFGNFIFNQELSVTLLVWRNITYYLGMIIGAILFNLEKKVK